MQRKRKSAKKNLLRTGRKPSALVIIPFHTPLCELSVLPITTSFQLCQFWVPASSCLWCWSIRPLGRRPSPWTRRCEHCDKRVPENGGDKRVLSKETLSSLATRMQCITFEFCNHSSPCPPSITLCVCYCLQFYKKRYLRFITKCGLKLYIFVNKLADVQCTW